MAVQDGYGKSSGTESLVFAYDLKDTINSYRGEPTTNIATNTPLQGGWGGGYTLLNGETKSFRFYMNSWSATPGASWRSFLWDVSEYSGQLVTISATFESANESSADFSWILIGETTGTQTYLGYSDGLHRNQKTTTDRERISWSGTVEDGQKVGFTVWADNGTGTFSVDVSNVQIEIGKTHPTPFINGSRSVTQGLLDLTSNSTIDLSNVSFDGDAQMTFDGTNDYLNVNTSLNSGNFTYETVMSVNDTTYPIFGAGYGTAGTTIQSYITSSGALINLYAPIGAGGWVYGSYSNLNGYVSVANQLRHIVVTNNNTTWQTYVDGSLVGNVTFYQPTTGTDVGIGRIAMQSPSNLSTVVKMVKLYNRVLTPTEVQNNYLKYRGLYGLG